MEQAPGRATRQAPRQIPRQAPTRATPRRRQTSLTHESVLTATIDALDQHGEEKLTLRGLAASLGSGVASIYWYADNKEHLLVQATAEIITRCLEEFHNGAPSAQAFAPYEPMPSSSQTVVDALISARNQILCLLHQMVLHPWLPQRLLRNDPDMDGSQDWEFWESMGQPFLATSLSDRQRFTASLSLMNYAIGSGAEFVQRDQAIEHVERETVLEEHMEVMDALDSERYPFIHSISSVFRDHHDDEQFAAGLDLLLRGIEVQALA